MKPAKSIDNRKQEMKLEALPTAVKETPKPIEVAKKVDMVFGFNLGFSNAAAIFIAKAVEPIQTAKAVETGNAGMAAKGIKETQSPVLGKKK